MLSELTQQMAGGTGLTDAQVAAAVAALAAAGETVEAKADFLAGLAAKGETTAEIAAFAQALRGLSVIPPLDKETRAAGILDVCGTGGDRLNTFNISTTVSLILASAEVHVAKHGNRAITSQAGSADVLEALGIKIDLTPEQAAVSLRDHHFAFFFAPFYHPAFKEIGPARKLCAERGQRTIFNFLGPLLNPAHPTAQLLGVPRRELCVPIATVLRTLGVKRGIVVCGEVEVNGNPRCLDEFSTLGKNHIAELRAPVTLRSLLLERFPIQAATVADLAGGDRQANAEIVRRLVHGEERGPKRDAILLNSAAALFVAERAESMGDGWAMAADLIDSGRAGRKLVELIEASKRA